MSVGGTKGTRLLVEGRPIDSEAVGEMTRALRRTAEYETWDSLGVGQKIRLPDVDDVGAFLRDQRWTGWAARREAKRLADAPRTAYRRWRVTVTVAMPGWFATLRATYVDEVPPFAAATESRRANADQRADRAEALRAQGKTIAEAAEAMGREPQTIVRYRRRKREGSTISSGADDVR